MRENTRRACAIVAVAMLATGCAKVFPYVSTLETEKRFTGGDSILFTEADLRGVINVNIPEGYREHGRVIPTRIICAEPSPDVAKAVSEGISAAAAVAAKGQGEGSIAASRSYAESLAQLGERLATIQLLRDGFYRACEAYSNGALSDSTYAVIVSGVDDLMVTLHATEIGGGAFGRSLATASSKAGGESGASADLAEKASRLIKSDEKRVEKVDEFLKTDEMLKNQKQETRNIKTQLAEERIENNQIKNELNQATGNSATPQEEVSALEARKNSSDERIEELNQSLEESRSEESRLATEREATKSELDEAKEEFNSSVAAHAKSYSEATATAGGAITPSQSPEVAEVLLKMQGQYLSARKDDLSPLVIACITALDRPPKEKATALSELCNIELPKLIAKK